MLRIVVLIAVIVLVIAVGLFLAQRKLIFPAPPFELPNPLPDNVEFIGLDSGYALLMHPTQRTEPVPLLIFAHGNAEVAYWSIPDFQFFVERGFAVLLLEYPGYGGAPGTPSDISIEKSSIAAYDKATMLPEIDEKRVVAYGRSIGSGAASLLAAKRPVAALVLESPFTSFRALVAELGYPTFLLRDHFDNASIIRELSVPVFLYHGIADNIIPISHSEELATLAKDAVFLKAECGHNDCPRPWPELLNFLQVKALPSAP